MKPVRAADLTNAVPVGRGHRSAQTMLMIRQRDALLRETAARFYPGVSGREAARLIRIQLVRYRQGRFRRDRTCDVCPACHAGRLTALLWLILKVRDHVPSEMTVRRALAFRDPANPSS